MDTHQRHRTGNGLLTGCDEAFFLHCIQMRQELLQISVAAGLEFRSQLVDGKQIASAILSPIHGSIDTVHPGHEEYLLNKLR